MSRLCTLLLLLGLVVGCSGPATVSDSSAAPHLAAMLPEVLSDLSSGSLEIASGEEGIGELLELAGMQSQPKPRAAASRSYRSGNEIYRVFVFELETVRAAESFFKAQGHGEPTPIPGFGQGGRTLVDSLGGYEVDVWSGRYFVRTFAESSDRQARERAYTACEAVIELAEARAGRDALAEANTGG